LPKHLTNLKVTLDPRNEVVHAFSDHTKVCSVFDPPAPVALKAGIQRCSTMGNVAGASSSVEFKALKYIKITQMAVIRAASSMKVAAYTAYKDYAAVQVYSSNGKQS